MNKVEYAAKLEATKVTDQNTIAEWREARKAKTALTRFWKAQALKHVRESTGEDLTSNPYNNLVFEFNLNPTGSIIIKKYSSPETGVSYSIPSSFLQEYRVPKSKILTPTTRKETQAKNGIKELEDRIDSISSLIYAIQQDMYNREVNSRRITGLQRQISNLRKKITVLQGELV